MRTVSHRVRRAALASVETLELRQLMAGVIALDWGDAPNTYRTTLVANGPRHDVTPNLLLGSAVDDEADGQPSAAADRDDFSGPVDDEDGITFLDPVVPGTAVDVQVKNGAATGFLSAWLDFNASGIFDAGELIFNNVPLPAASTTTQTFVVPNTAIAGGSFARFRLSGTVVAAPVNPFGPGGFGEVEDYPVAVLPPPVQLLDYGDAPNSYRTTLAVNGARHNASPNIRLGANVDAEPDGQPGVNANRDDLTGVPDDEDGVIFLNPIIAGGVANVQVTNGGGGSRLNAWFDFNANGIFNAGEQIFTNVNLPAASVNVLAFVVPLASATGQTYSRWRINAAGGLAPFGAGGFGEVEDYLNRVDAPTPPKLDYGDAPNTYGTTVAVNGARHNASPNIRLGANIDAEADGAPSVLADKDDLTGVPDDEDGVLFLTPIITGNNAMVQVSNGGAASRLNAWYDFNINGVFDAAEQIFTNVPLAAASVNVLNFFVPAGSAIGQTYSRWRINTGGGIGPIGAGGFGEVEDYENRTQPPTNQQIDFGDAPDFAGAAFQYPTLLGGVSGNPARHAIAPNGPRLGNIVDAENDGQPNIPATGDDLANLDDEDGITVGGVPLELVSLTLGSVAGIEVTNGGAPGFLNAWFDFNQNGSWQPAEQVALNVPIAPGTTVINVNIPAGLNPGTFLYSRFRLSTVAGLQPTGPATDGEVEDYRTVLRAPPPAQLLDFGDAPEIPGTVLAYPTTLGGPSGDPARHIINTAGPRLGNRIDPEPDGQPNLAASGDDIGLLFGGIDDEDGVFVGGAPLETVPLVPGSVLPVQVSNPTGVAGLLNAWFDWNSSGTWEAAEQVAINLPAGPGITFVPVAVPATLSPNSQIYSRFRISTAAGLTPRSLAQDGEVEDYVQRVNVDTVRPFVIDGKLEFERSQSVLIEFSEPMDAATVQPSDLLATNLTNGSTPAALMMEWVYGTELARFHFNMAGMFVSDGNYKFEIAANSMTDHAGNPLAMGFTHQGADAFWFAADADRSRRVNLDDFTTLAANFGMTGKLFSQGNFNYSAAGEVTLDDFTILAAQFGKSLPFPADLPRASINGGRSDAVAGMFGNQLIDRETVDNDSRLIDVVA